ncbi:MAG: hypothetical protein ABIR59_13515 [Gemmatimonadales bacterium]
MRVHSTVAIAFLLASCSAPPPDEPPADLPVTVEPTLADTHTVDGVLEMRHGSDALARAQRWVLSAKPDLIIDGGDKADFDLTHVTRPMRFANGRVLATYRVGPARLMLFNADGAPWRIVARSGEGPGDVMAPTDPVRWDDDTAMVHDFANHRVNWITADGKVARDAPLATTVSSGCFRAEGRLADGRFLAIGNCIEEVASDSVIRLRTQVIAVNYDYSAVDTLAVVPGWEMAPFETRYRGVRRGSVVPLRFGRSTSVAPWGAGVAVASALGGYTIERRALDGTVTARLVVETPRRAVTEAMRQAMIARGLEAMEGSGAERMVDSEESRRMQREMPFADSLPPYQHVWAGDDGLLWVVDAQALADTTWAATAFRVDGAIMARIVSRRFGMPVSFTRGSVMVREVDDDDVVRFAVYRWSAASGTQP